MRSRLRHRDLDKHDPFKLVLLDDRPLQMLGMSRRVRVQATRFMRGERLGRTWIELFNDLTGLAELLRHEETVVF